MANSDTNKLHVELYKTTPYAGDIIFTAFGIIDDKPILEFDTELREANYLSGLYDFAEAYGCLYRHNAHGGKQRLNLNPEEVAQIYKDVKEEETAELIASDICGNDALYGFIPEVLTKFDGNYLKYYDLMVVNALADLVYMRWASPNTTREAMSNGLLPGVRNDDAELMADLLRMVCGSYIYCECPTKHMYGAGYCERKCLYGDHCFATSIAEGL